MTEPGHRRPRGAATKRRILDVADRLFYRSGIRAVSVEDIVDAAETTRMTFYRHYPSKDDLAVAYLERRAEHEREGLRRLAAESGSDRRTVFLGVARALARATAADPFYGCPFLSAAGEFRDPEHPVRRVVDTHRAWFRAAVARLAEAAGLLDPGRVADRVVVLRDGVMVGGFFGPAPGRAGELERAMRAIVGASDPARPRHPRAEGRPRLPEPRTGPGAVTC